jgi:hypothetical protein
MGGDLVHAVALADVAGLGAGVAIGTLTVVPTV